MHFKKAYAQNLDYQKPLIAHVLLYLMASAYSALDYYFFTGRIDYFWYLASTFLLDDVFFSGVIENFQEQGGVFAANRINVGELTAPINGSGFILDPSIVNKFSRVF